MGRPSDKRRSARRPGQSERARVKKSRRCISYVIRGSVSGNVSIRLKAGPKKMMRAMYSRNAHNPFSIYR